MTKSAAFGEFPAPHAPRHDHTDTRHGITRTDEYAWMRAENWQQVFKDPSTLDGEIRRHLEAENAYQEKMLEGLKDLRKQLVAEMRGRIKEDDASVPMPDGPFAYGTKFVTGGEQPHVIRTKRDGSGEQVLIDGDAEAEGKAYFRLAGADHSPDHSKMVWGHDDKGSEFFTLSVRDLSTGKDLADRIENTGGGATWTNGSDGLVYTAVDDNHRPSKVFFHRLGTTQDDDLLLYEEADPGFFTGAGSTLSRAFIIIDSHNHETGEVRLLDADDPTGTQVLVAERRTGVEYSVEEAHGTLYILTNDNGAKDFKIVTAPASNPGTENWRDLVAHEPGRLILAHGVFARHLVWLERRDGLPRIMIRRLADGETHAIAFEEEAYSLGLSGWAEFDTDVIRFSYSSMTTPSQQFEYNMETRERRLLKTQEVPSGHDPDAYVTRRLLVPAGDGETVPVSLLYRKDTALDGTAPCLLYGYGSYGIAIPAAFNTNCLSLVDRGFVYAIAHVRGGKDKGYHWYEDGKREKKTNTFKDFIAVARHLSQAGFTRADRIVAQGGSAGGMLMGAVANMAPEAFGGIIAEVPFVDVLTTMLDDTLPLTPPEWPEWGNPISSKADYETIAAYSPVDNVRSLPYPPILAVSGLTDPRVTYWEPAKWVAKLREHSTSGNPVLFRINMDAGHAGASGRFSRLEEVALNYAFALKVTGHADAAIA